MLVLDFQIHSTVFHFLNSSSPREYSLQFAIHIMLLNFVFPPQMDLVLRFQIQSLFKSVYVFMCCIKILVEILFFSLTLRDCFNMQKLGFIFSSRILVRFCLEFTLRTFIPPSQLGEVLDKCVLDKLFLDKIFTCCYTE